MFDNQKFFKNNKICIIVNMKPKFSVQLLKQMGNYYLLSLVVSFC